jgi:hypothetical protein
LRHLGKKLLQSETLTSISQHGQATVVQRMGQLDLFQHDTGLTAQSGSHQIADLWRQGRDVAYGARAWALGGAKGLAHQVFGFARSGIRSYTVIWLGTFWIQPGSKIASRFILLFLDM